MSTNRLYYLDNLRAFCMLFGILLQTKRVGDFDVSPYVTVASDYFRMATFFLISGFFIQMLLARDKDWTIVKRRLWVLIVPLIFGLVVINPVTNSIASRFVADAIAMSPLDALFAAINGAPNLPTPDGGLQHLWFLIILVVFVLLSPFLKKLATSSILKFLPKGAWFIPVLGIVIAVFSVAARGADEVLSRITEQDLGLLRVFLRYLPFFFIGMIGFTSSGIWSNLHTISVPGLLLGAVLVYLGTALPQLQNGAIGTLYFVGARAVLTIALVAALLKIFAMVFDIGTQSTRFISQGVYTAYLLQILLIWVVAAGAITLGLSGTALYVTTVLVTLIAGHSIWYFVVQHVPILRLLLSGKM